VSPKLNIESPNNLNKTVALGILGTDQFINEEFTGILE
jgi:hypothetical protein